MNDTAGWNGVRFDVERAMVEVRDRVRLHDTDSSGRIFYGAVTNWFNNATSELTMGLGFEPRGLVPNPMLPVVAASMRYHEPMKIGDPYAVQGWVARAGRSSLTLGFEVTVDRTRCVSGETIHVHIGADGRPAPLPPELVRAARER